MADYYTEASFVIPCTEEQAETAVNTLEHINEKLSQYAKLAILKANSVELKPKDKIIRHCFFNHPDQNKSNSVEGLDWDFNVDACYGGVWIYSDVTINTEQAAIFTQAVLIAFNLPTLIEIQASNTCSKQRINAFGGHACVVSKDFIRWDCLHDFLQAEHQAHKQSERYFLCHITELNGEYEYNSHFLMKCIGNNSPEKRLNEIFVNYRGKGDKISNDFVLYPNGSGAKKPCMSEITPHEFKIMQAHLSVL